MDATYETIDLPAGHRLLLQGRVIRCVDKARLQVAILPGETCHRTLLKENRLLVLTIAPARVQDNGVLAPATEPSPADEITR